MGDDEQATASLDLGLHVVHRTFAGADAPVNQLADTERKRMSVKSREFESAHREQVVCGNAVHLAQRRGRVVIGQRHEVEIVLARKLYKPGHIPTTVGMNGM